MIDIIFLSYDEPMADVRFNRLKLRFPHVKRVHGVKGIYNAHVAASRLSNTGWFYVVDADASIHADFDFSLCPAEWDVDYVHVFRSRNPVNGLVYGYGGVKIFHKSMFEYGEAHIDVSTSISKGIKPINVVASTSNFNDTAEQAFRSGFREATKLAGNIIDFADERSVEWLNIWTTVGADKLNGAACIAGAKLGKEFGLANGKDHNTLMMINDYMWLKDKFNEWNAANQNTRM